MGLVSLGGVSLCGGLRIHGVGWKVFASMGLTMGRGRVGLRTVGEEQ